MHVDYGLQILILIGAFPDHFTKILAVLYAFLCDSILILEPFFSHLGRTGLDLLEPKVVVFYENL